MKKKNTNEANNLEDINININKDKIVKFISNVKINNMHFKLIILVVIVNIAQKQYYILLINVQPLNIIVINAKLFYVLITFIIAMKKNLTVRRVNSSFANLIIQIFKYFI